jgi:hypothetical protein
MMFVIPYFLFLIALLIGIYLTIHSFRSVQFNTPKSTLMFWVLFLCFLFLIPFAIYNIWLMYPHGTTAIKFDFWMFSLAVSLFGGSFGIAFYLSYKLIDRFNKGGR